MANSIEIDAAAFAALKRTARAVDSPYLEDVKALRKGFARKIDIPEGSSGRKVVNDVHKAAKQLGVKVQVLLREKATPPMVVFKLADEPVADSTKSE
jgi:hypothetical protein